MPLRNCHLKHPGSRWLKIQRVIHIFFINTIRYNKENCRRSLIVYKTFERTYMNRMQCNNANSKWFSIIFVFSISLVKNDAKWPHLHFDHVYDIVSKRNPSLYDISKTNNPWHQPGEIRNSSQRLLFLYVNYNDQKLLWPIMCTVDK